MSLIFNPSVNKELALVSLGLPFLMSNQAIAYPPLPQYGSLQFPNAFCIIQSISGANPSAVQWGANAQGFGFPGVQYQCSGSFKIQNNSTGRTCLGVFSAVQTPPPTLFTDGGGAINPGAVPTGILVSATNAQLPASCSSIVTASGVSMTITTFPSCGLSIGGGLDVLLTGYGANCTST